jgi:hypothetical protein
MAAAMLVLILCPVLSLGDGGGPEMAIPECHDMPLPKATDPVITGIFTVAYDRSQITLESPTSSAHYNTHMIFKAPLLKNGKETVKTRLYSFPVSVAPQTHLCDYPDEHFMEKYKNVPCNRKIGKHFGLPGVPVLTEVTVTHRTCSPPGDRAARTYYDESMITGTIKIRMSQKP